ncbi:hypothetical protein [Pseudosulfitobacter sp. SM2401]|uniref:hypothetical protein n=1 Tax=Pseudosulfitobacter sp. SM2401 TaxID=3350098 RepID=UPI0036F1A5A0
MIRLSGVRQGAYWEQFSKQAATFKDYLAAEFIADFLGGKGSHVNLDITSKAGTNSAAYCPRDVSQLVELGPQILSPIECAETEQLSVVGYARYDCIMDSFPVGAVGVCANRIILFFNQDCCCHGFA